MKHPLDRYNGDNRARIRYINPGAPVVFVVDKPTWDECRNNQYFVTPACNLIKSFCAAKQWDYGFLYLCPYATPGNRYLTNNEMLSSVSSMATIGNNYFPESRRVAIDYSSYYACGGKRKPHTIEGSWLPDVTHPTMYLDAAKVIESPDTFRVFSYGMNNAYAPEVRKLQQPFVEWELVVSPDQLVPILDADLVAMDIESASDGKGSLDFMRGSLTAIALSYKDGHALIIPPSHIKDPTILHYLRMIMSTCTIVGHHFKFDMRWLKPIGLPYPTKFIDTMLTHYTINEQGAGRPMRGSKEELSQGHGLKLLSRLFLYVDDYADVSYAPQTDEEWHRLWHYAGVDVDNTRRLLPILQAKQDDRARKQSKILHDLSEVLFWMEYRGVLLDQNKAQDLSVILTEQEEEVRAIMGGMVDRLDLNPRSYKQLQWALYEYYGAPPVYDRKEHKLTTNKDAIRSTIQWAKQNDREELIKFLNLLTEHRNLSRTRGTYADGLLKRLGTDGRIRTNFKLTGTVTQRLSSADPNLQNIPAPYRQDPYSKLIKSMFIAAPGNVLVEADLSQAELRAVALYSGDENMLSVYNKTGGDIHNNTMYSAWPETLKLDKENPLREFFRRVAKVLNFGIVYGMEAKSVMEEVNSKGEKPITISEARDAIKKWFAAYPKVKAYLDQIVRAVREEGVCVSVFGGRRLFGDGDITYIPRTNKEFVAFANHTKNWAIQHTAGVLTELALIKIHHEFERRWTDVHLRLTVHDSIIAECPVHRAREVAELMTHIMQTVGVEWLGNAIQFASDAKVGYNWGELISLEKWEEKYGNQSITMAEG